MKKRLKEILDIAEVQGVIYLSVNGELIFNEFKAAPPLPLETINWSPFILALHGIRETELIFENIKIYIRLADSGFLIVVSGKFTNTSLVRLNCDILLPQLPELKKKSKGFARFFR